MIFLYNYIIGNRILDSVTIETDNVNKNNTKLLTIIIDIQHKIGIILIIINHIISSIGYLIIIELIIEHKWNIINICHMS